MIQGEPQNISHLIEVLKILNFQELKKVGLEEFDDKKMDDNVVMQPILKCLFLAKLMLMK